MTNTIFQAIYLKERFYYATGAVVCLFVFSLFVPFIYYISIVACIILLLLCLYELYTLTRCRKFVSVMRSVHQKLSLGDPYELNYVIKYSGSIPLSSTLYDEFPVQLQYRSSVASFIIAPDEDKMIFHSIFPKSRGIYTFGNVILYITSLRFQFVELRLDFDMKENVKVVPSILQMKKYSLYTNKRASHLTGIKKIRTIGENDEFELIRNYQQGDNVKSINWKATSRVNTLMVNQYQDTRSQEVLCIIDKGRTMEMPFEGLSLLDYSINSALVISNICLHKSDRAGLITFAKNIDTYIKADAKNNQLQLILEHLYAQATQFNEHNFELLYYTLKSKTTRRSIIFLYSNFETLIDLERNLSYLEHINKDHILILISFINSELENEIVERPAVKSDDVFRTTMAQKLYFERFSIEKVLRNKGIQIIFTKPEDLNINVINKYLEIKAKRQR